MLQKQEKEGFTLIELLIVVCIIAILTLAAVSSYTGVQVQANVDFAADTMVSTFREAQVYARSGRVVEGESGELNSQCYIVRIVPGVSEEAGIFTRTTPYVGVSGDIVDSCQVVSEESGWKRSNVINERIILIGEESEARTFYFKPPFAKIFEAVGGGLEPSTSQKVEFFVGALNQPEWNRKVQFDLTTGTAMRL